MQDLLAARTSDGGAVIENLRVQGIPAAWLDRVNAGLANALDGYFDDRPIYTLSATDLGEAAALLVLKRVVVENSELVVVLGI